MLSFRCKPLRQVAPPPWPSKKVLICGSLIFDSMSFPPCLNKVSTRRGTEWLGEPGRRWRQICWKNGYSSLPEPSLAGPCKHGPQISESGLQLWEQTSLLYKIWFATWGRIFHGSSLRDFPRSAYDTGQDGAVHKFTKHNNFGETAAPMETSNQLSLGETQRNRDQVQGAGASVAAARSLGSPSKGRTTSSASRRYVVRSFSLKFIEVHIMVSLVMRCAKAKPWYVVLD